jgi:hypothetical protein
MEPDDLELIREVAARLNGAAETLDSYSRNPASIIKEMSMSQANAIKDLLKRLYRKYPQII